ncbi:MAG: peptide MFS transporter [Pirellulaceae bacterium]|nr:peptide MFS transporter [Pirellulaceae bacterium]
MVQNIGTGRTLFGHPVGLFLLFFAELWERFSYYGMRALLVFYMTKGFLSYNDDTAYGVYGAYTALVYATPFIGGMLADKFLGSRLCVIIGGILMALGHLAMTLENRFAFFGALSLLIVGNGFFKPNISTIVGSLYPEGSKLRDGGFTIFYIGINLGAAMSPLLCGYIGETYGWHYGFGLATAGMLVGLATFVMPNLVSQLLIGAAGLTAASSLFIFHPNNTIAIAMNIFVGVTLLAAACTACIALNRGGLPSTAGLATNGRASIGTILKVLFGIVIAIPFISLLVSGFSILNQDGKQIRVIQESTIKSFTDQGGAVALVGVVLEEISKPAGLVLMLMGIVALGYISWCMVKMTIIQRQRMYVVLTLTFFSLLFWAFFEQAGSSLNNYTDRNVDRVVETSVVSNDQVGSTIRLQPTQEQLGYSNGSDLFLLDTLTKLRKENADPHFEIEWNVTKSNVGMGLATRDLELPASTFQSVNAIYILILGLVFTTLWTYLGSRGMEPSTPIKFGLGLLQLGLGFGAFWLGAYYSSDRGMVAVFWLLLGYLLHTTGELCLSPVGLSMIVKLSPKILVSTVMGMWFLATAFSQYLAGMIAMLTSAEQDGGESGGVQRIPAPIDSVHVFGDLYLKIAIAAIISACICLALSPLLKRWMHEEAETDR